MTTATTATTATTELDLDKLTLTTDQQAALDAFYRFLMDPIEMVFVLSGYSGCGKSTLVRTIMDRLPGFQKTIRLINPQAKDYEVKLTATTNKAAENLAQITGMDVGTVQSFLGLRVDTDFRTNVTKLVPRNNFQIPEYVLLFIDEASFIDKELLGHVFTRTKYSKVVFIGDPAQLIPVKSTNTPVFNAGFSGAALTQVVRQAKDNPIVDLSTKFRHTVNTGEFFGFKPDGHYVRRLNRTDFNAAIEAEFTRPNWRYQDSKILGWTNKCVIAFNQYVRSLAKGDPHFQEDDYAVCNSFLTVGKQTLKTDQLVQITGIESDSQHYQVNGNWVMLDDKIRTFHPKSLAEKNERIKVARAAEDTNLLAIIENSWVDLRGAYACTINKAQGSTFDSVFLDLDDVSRCNSGDQIARMLYVAVSRARNHVYLCGDLA
jgi:energy-coupling factor transporter ATP-binding protein EcfA2